MPATAEQPDLQWEEKLKYKGPEKFDNLAALQKVAHEKGIEVFDLNFTSMHGMHHQPNFPIQALTHHNVENGLGFDGSSIRNLSKIYASDMLLFPDISTAVIDELGENPTITITCDVVDPTTGKPTGKSPRGVSERAIQHLKNSGIADTAYVGPEPEFFIFDHVEWNEGPDGSSYRVDSAQADWNSNRNNPTDVPFAVTPTGKGYCIAPPGDQLKDIRIEMVQTLQKMGIETEYFHSEVGTGGQTEIDMRYDDLQSMADKLNMFKYIIKMVAANRGKVATFMPKPIYGDNGSGMHVHLSLWKNEKNLFYKKGGYADLSPMARQFVAGLVENRQALCAITNPTTNSYARLVPGFEAPTTFVHSQKNRSAGIRIPGYHDSPESKRIEARFPDPAGESHLVFSAILMAGIDGIRRKLELGKPIEGDIYDLPAKEVINLPSAPTFLDKAVDALAENHDFLTQGDVFTDEFIREYVWAKREEIDKERARPNPHQFAKHFNV